MDVLSHPYAAKYKFVTKFTTLDRPRGINMVTFNERTLKTLHAEQPALRLWLTRVATWASRCPPLARVAAAIKASLLMLMLAPCAVHAATIDFANLADSQFTVVSTYNQAGFVVQSSAGLWLESHNFGNPAPSIRSAHATASISVRRQDGNRFAFTSVDIGYNGVPYVITGHLGPAIVFTFSGDTTVGTEFETTSDAAVTSMEIDRLEVTVSKGTRPRPSFHIDNIVLADLADLAITKTDGVTTAVAGGSLTYTITASSAGLTNVTGATVTDTLPVELSGATWTCVGAGGGTCTASGSGSIADTVNLPNGGSVTYTLSATLAATARVSTPNSSAISAATASAAGRLRSEELFTTTFMPAAASSRATALAWRARASQ